MFTCDFATTNRLVIPADVHGSEPQTDFLYAIYVHDLRDTTLAPSLLASNDARYTAWVLAPSAVQAYGYAEDGSLFFQFARPTTGRLVLAFASERVIVPGIPILIPTQLCSEEQIHVVEYDATPALSTEVDDKTIHIDPSTHIVTVTLADGSSRVVLSPDSPAKPSTNIWTVCSDER